MPKSPRIHRTPLYRAKARIGDVGHYEIGNIQIVSQAMNRAEQARRTATHPSGKKRCSWCKEEKDLSAFGVRRSALDGLQSRCKLCIRERG